MTEPKIPEMLRHEYARSALNLGLELEDKGVGNPYRFGLIGSTDSHTSLATTREDNYFGKIPVTEPSAERGQHVFFQSPDKNLTILSSEEVASGLAGVWARENTRESLFDAMNRKEVYATTGSRILVRVFAGYDFQEDDVDRADFAETGYAGGVPMGGELANTANGKAPRLIVRALRDPDNANLDRIQIVKGWLNGDGTTEERIYDVACADDRAIVDRRCEKPVGNTVEGASYTNNVGDSYLTAFWEDPDFEPSQPAWYYVRVIEIPKPSWQAYDVARLGAEMPEGATMVVQDRAYTSPIWYDPR